MKEEEYHDFLKKNRDEINDIVSKTLLEQDLTIISRIKRGFMNSIKNCFFALCSNSGMQEIVESQRITLLNIIRLLLLAIKKRFYAFPDRNIIAVVHDQFFDEILPEAIKLNLITNSNNFISLFFNAGENLGKNSQDFYDKVTALLLIIATEKIPLESLIQVVAWAAGDLNKREHALKVLNDPNISPTILNILQFGRQYPLASQPGSHTTKNLHELLLSSLNNDYWRLPSFAIDQNDMTRVLQELQENSLKISDITINELKKKYGIKNLEGINDFKNIGSVGSFQGFNGIFDTPPTIIGAVGHGVIIAYTGSGKIFHITYCKDKTRVRSLGTFKAKSLHYSKTLGLVGLTKENKIRYLSRGLTKSIKLPKQSESILSTIGDKSFFLITLKNNYFHAITPNDDKYNITKSKLKIPVLSMVALNDEEVLLSSLIKSKSNSKQEYAMHVFNINNKKLNFLVSFKNPTWICANARYMMFLEKNGKIHVINNKTREQKDYKTKIQTNGLLSLAITDREIITSYDYTHKIFFHGPPI